jgi:hypothetical protein
MFTELKRFNPGDHAMNAPVVIKKRNERSAPQNSPSEIRQAYPYFHVKRTHQCANYLFLWGLACEAARKMWPQNVDQNGQWVWPAGAQFDVKDGDVPFQSKPKPGQPLPDPVEVAKKNEWRKGYWIVEAENFLPDTKIAVAKIVNGQVVDIVAQSINGVEQYKSGDWGIPNLHAYAFENETFGCNFGFDGFLFTREGERIGNNAGPKSAAQMFGSVAGTVANSNMPGATAAQQVMPNGAVMAPPAAPVAPPAAPPAPSAPVYAAAPPPPPGMAGLPPIPGR